MQQIRNITDLDGLVIACLPQDRKDEGSNPRPAQTKVFKNWYLQSLV